MIEFGRHEPDKPPPKLELPTPVEIEGIIRDIVKNYDGEELIKQLSEFCMLNMVEVILTQDQSPVPLQRLGGKRREIVQRLLKPDEGAQNTN